VFPPALAVAQALGRSGRELLTAAVAGYEVGIRVGEFLGRTHYKVFHTTGTAGTIAAAATTGRLLNLAPERMQHALGSAGTQAAGLWEFLRDAADSKQLHTAKAASDGLLAAYLAQAGFTGAKNIFEGPQGMAAAMSHDSDPAKLTDRLGGFWALLETSFKHHACCRHTHPAADALLLAIQQNNLDPGQIRRVTAHVHQGAIDVLGAVDVPQTVHQAKFSMGTALGLIAHFGRAGLREFDEHYKLSFMAVSIYKSWFGLREQHEKDGPHLCTTQQARRECGTLVVGPREGTESSAREEPGLPIPARSFSTGASYYRPIFKSSRGSGPWP
jgi:2-methylcitrate dehydratase PrpD